MMPRLSSFSRRAAALATLALAACSTDRPTQARVLEVEALLAKGGAKPANSLSLTISGLPAGTAAGVRVTGPNGFSQTLNASGTLNDLVDGNYTIDASRVVVGATAYDPSPASQTLSLRRGRTGSASVVFSAVPTTGSLAVTINIAEPASAPVNVSGPNAFNQAVPSTQTLSSLAPGSYAVSASNVTAPSGVAYVASVASQSVSVVAGATAAVTVTYTATSVPPSDSINLQILGAYLTQSTQTMAGDVPLVTGRDGVLRVFAMANRTNSLQPRVRARFYASGSLVATYTASASGSAVPTALDEASSTAAWKIRVPGSVIQPGLSVLTDVDPDGAISESSESDNAFPISGSPLPLNVRTVPNLAVRFVPVYQSTPQLLGNISDANSATFLQPTRDMFPLSTVSSSVRATYSTNTTLLSDGAGWSPLLSELRALRSADGSSDHYYGVAKVAYSGGVAGIGYIGLPTSLGWDYSSGAVTMAHEFGHNWGRQHAPCGNPGGPDPSYPYSGGIIGAYGYNVRTDALVARTTADLMGYCSPRWISDYTYRAVLNYRGSTTSSLTVGASVEPSLLVWGRIAADGEIVLEPAIRLDARAVLPARAGAYTIEATDAAGSRLVSLSFDPDETSDDAGSVERHFAFVVPMREGVHARLQTLRVNGNGRSVQRSRRFDAPGLARLANAATVDDVGPGRARLRWDAGAVGAAMVVARDPASGAILTFGRSGEVALATGDVELDLVVSDGVQSVSRRVRVRGR